MVNSWKTVLRLCFTIFIAGGIFVSVATPVAQAQDVELYTPYSEITVPPGESVRFVVDVTNATNSQQRADVEVTEAPDHWTYHLRASGWEVHQVYVPPQEFRSVNFEVEIPLEVERGSYYFELSLNNGQSVLPLTIHVDESGTFQSELSSNQANMQGHADSAFNYSVKINNRTAEDQLYSLRSEAPARGWDVRFMLAGNRISSIQVDANSTTSFQVQVLPPENVEAGTYEIDIQAANQSTSTDPLQLETVITGTYAMELTTPSGLLSYDVTEGSQRTIELEVRNIGTSELKDIDMSASVPNTWEADFEPKVIRNLPAGETATVQAMIKAADKSLPGDYQMSLSASTPEVSAKADEIGRAHV